MGGILIEMFIEFRQFVNDINAPIPDSRLCVSFR